MPKEKQQRTQSRRAASKEALKQMHMLLGDEKKYEISSDDDDVIEVEVQPPKKKYKLSHRKSSDGNDRDVIVLKTVEENFFDLEVVVEDLAPCQKSRQDVVKKEIKEVDEKIEQLVSKPNTEVIYNGVFTTAVEITEQIQTVISSTQSPSQYTLPSQPPPAPAVQQPVPSQSIVLQQQNSSNNALPQSYQLVMDPRLGVIVGAVSTAPNASSNTPPLQLYQPKVTVPSSVPQGNSEQPAMKTRRGTILRQVGNSMPPLHKTTPATTIVKATPPPNKQNKTLQVKSVKQMVQPKPTPQPPATQKTITPKPIVAFKGRVNKTPVNANTIPGPTFRPTESSVEGGLCMGKPSKSIDLTGEDGRALPDSREVSFNKLQGRTYPSLVVVARPHLRVKDLAGDRGKLDVKVKSVLMYPPTKFTEWLIQQGLVRSDQKCSIHATNPLKLGMYSDATKFPYSGGYVWISECCPQRFVSVFSGSLFEGSQHPPMAILKLLYHWCCQTIVQNVTQWVKVDNLYVKGMYTWLRAVCTVALHTHVKQLGGPGVKIQVGVISLGTTSNDGNKREVKVEVLGILETTTRHIRLRAVEPLTEGERNYKKRFNKILEPVFNWVHPSSIIVTDLTVDKATLHQMGFLHVSQSTSTDYAQSNRTIMEYLRRIVPRMFQNTLSLLSRQIIQQFLDELVWREWFGTTVLTSFDNMVKHLSEQTRYDSGQSLNVRLNKVSANPFKNWSIPLTSTTATPAPAKVNTEQITPKRYSRQRKPQVATPQPPAPVVQDVMRPAKSTSPDVPEQMVPLENYYYGTITPPQSNRTKITINIKCPFCKLSFNSNITLMNHLFKHAHNVSNDVQLCKYCLTIVPTGNDLLKHIGTAHPDETKFDNGFVCLICEAHFRNPFILGKHMSKEHCPSELPYLCGTCNFRCSNHKQAVDHFYQQHDQGTTIQCPFCLKSTTIFSGGRNISQNMNYFIQHLQKHQKKNLAKRCGRCTLWFIQKEFLKDHQIKMHISQRGKSGLIPCFAPRNGVMVPKSRMDKCPDDAKVINFSTLYFNVGKNLHCKECNVALSTPKHFASFESCQNPNCQFSTCCAAAMREHVAKCKFLNSKLPAEKLPYEMHCICGYSDVHGNMMAKHLAICERKSAYPSKDAAKKATVTHSMLDVLGLVRKPDEPTTSNKEPPKRPETTSVQPIILKHRGRPRKNPVKEVIGASEVQINISEVRGGVDCTDVKNEKKEVKRKVDLTEKETAKNDDKKEETVVIIDDKDDISEKKDESEAKEDGREKEVEVVPVENKLEDAVTKEEKADEKQLDNKEEEQLDNKEEEQLDNKEESQSEVVSEETKDSEEQCEVAIDDKQQEVENEDNSQDVNEHQQKEIIPEVKEKEVITEDKEVEIVEDEKKEFVQSEETQEKEVELEEKEVEPQEKEVELEEKEVELEEKEVEPQEKEVLQDGESQGESVVQDEETKEKEVPKEEQSKDVTEVEETQDDNSTPSECTEDISEQIPEKVDESEKMEVDSCNNTDEKVAIENMEENIENIDICPMDTD